MSDNLRGILWMALAALSLAAGFVFMRKLSSELPPVEIAFLRAVVSCCILIPWLVRGGWDVLKMRRPGVYAIRAVAFYGGVVLWIYGLAHMEIAAATAIYFLTPLFTVMFAARFLDEAIGRTRWIAILIGFAGALVIIRPGIVEITWPAIAVVVTAILFGISNMTTRALTLTENTNTVVAYEFLLTVLLGAIPAALFWVTPSWEMLGYAVILGAVGVLSQQAFTRSFAAAPTSAVMAPYYLQLPFAALFAFLWFSEVPNEWIWVGAAIICGSTYYVAVKDGKEETKENG